MSANSPAMAANFSVKRGYVIEEPLLEISMTTTEATPGNPNTTFFVDLAHKQQSGSPAYHLTLSDTYNGLKKIYYSR